jgi:hypothetical protein
MQEFTPEQFTMHVQSIMNSPLESESLISADSGKLRNPYNKHSISNLNRAVVNYIFLVLVAANLLCNVDHGILPAGSIAIK